MFRYFEKKKNQKKQTNPKSKEVTSSRGSLSCAGGERLRSRSLELHIPAAAASRIPPAAEHPGTARVQLGPCTGEVGKEFWGGILPCE